MMSLTLLRGDVLGSTLMVIRSKKMPLMKSCFRHRRCPVVDFLRFGIPDTIRLDFHCLNFEFY